MTSDDKSIRGRIEWLARRTGAPNSFVEQVHTLFRSKGISLDAEVSPYLSALDEAFRREQAIRDTAGRAQRSVAELQEHFSKLGEAYRRQLDQLKRIRSSLESSSRNVLRGGAGRRKARAGKPTLGGKVLLSRVERDGLWMVPGPKDVQ